MKYKGIEMRTLSELRSPKSAQKGKNRVIRTDDETWERLAREAGKAGTSIGEMIRAVMVDWLDRDEESEGEMDEKTYADELARAKYFMRCDEERAEFWRGYHKGLHAAHDGTASGSEHEALIAIGEDEPDERRRQRGQGYKAGIEAVSTGEPYKE